MENTGQKNGIKTRIQQLGSRLSDMVMANIGGFIALGLILGLFSTSGYIPNAQLAMLADPMLKFMLPIMIAYAGGNMVYGQRGAVVGAISVVGMIVATTIPMFIGAMIMGPLSSWCLKKFDELIQGKIKAGFEMLVNNFSSGLIGTAFVIVSFYIVGPLVGSLTTTMNNGIEEIIRIHLLPLVNLFIEPAKILFLNNAINQGIITPIGMDQVAHTGKSLLFLLESNPGPGVGILLAFTLCGRGKTKLSAPGALIIHLFGGIHEVYFPYVLMKPILFLAVIAGGVAGTLTFQLLGGGLRMVVSPGSILAILAMSPPKSIVANLAGIIIGGAISFFLAVPIVKSLNQQEERIVPISAVSEEVSVVTKQAMSRSIDKVIFACDAGMGSSAMGASILRKSFQEVKLPYPVSNAAINSLSDDPQALIITQEKLHDRAKKKAPSATFVEVKNFMNSPRYDEIVEWLSNGSARDSASEEITTTSFEHTYTHSSIDHIIIAYDQVKGSAHMGATLLKKLVKDQTMNYQVTVMEINELANDKRALIVTYEEETSIAKQQAPSACHISLSKLVVIDKYDAIIAMLKGGF